MLSSYAYLSVAPGAAGDVSLLPEDEGGVGLAGVPAGPGDLVAADLAIDIIVRPDGHYGDVNRPAAVAARQALLVINPALDVDLLGLKHGPLASWAASVLPGRLDDGGV